MEEFRLYCIYTLWNFTRTKIVFIVKTKYLLRKKENENVDIEHENENEVMETDEILHETVNDVVNQSLEFL